MEEKGKLVFSFAAERYIYGGGFWARFTSGLGIGLRIGVGCRLGIGSEVVLGWEVDFGLRYVKG